MYQLPSLVLLLLPHLGFCSFELVESIFGVSYISHLRRALDQSIDECFYFSIL